MAKIGRVAARRCGIMAIGPMALMVALAVLSTPAQAGGCGEDHVAGALPAPATVHAVAMDLMPVQGDVFLGTWSTAQDPSNNSGIHCHILTIRTGTDDGELAAFVDTIYPNGRSLQTCDAALADRRIVINCDVVTAIGIYSPDNFTLDLIDGHLIGRNVDDAGTFGDVEFCRQ